MWQVASEATFVRLCVVESDFSDEQQHVFSPCPLQQLPVDWQQLLCDPDDAQWQTSSKCPVQPQPTTVRPLMIASGIIAQTINART